MNKQPSLARFAGSFPLIGLAARAQSGKSTAASHLKTQAGYKEDSFAAPIRQFVATLLGLTVAEMEPVKEKVVDWLGKSPRQMMQTFGTDWGREKVHPDIWIEACMQRIARDPKGRYVISDLRFDNEADAIRRMGGAVVHIVRPDALVVNSHASEAGVKRAAGDFLIVNDGPLEQFHKAIDDLLYGMWKGSPSILRAFQ